MMFQPAHNTDDLLKLVSQGDRTAFESLFNNYRNKIYSISFELTESSTISEEIVQDVFLKIWLKRDTIGSIGHFEAYLFTMARNYVFTALKRVARKQSVEKNAARGTLLFYNDTENKVFDKEYDKILQAAIDRLPLQQRQVYDLIKMEGYKREEAAAALQLSPETVKTHLAKAMLAIRAYCLARIEIPIALLLLIRKY